jgi:hypothetical protein
MEQIELVPLCLNKVGCREEGDPEGWSAPFALIDIFMARDEPYLGKLLAPCSKQFGAAFVSGIARDAIPGAWRSATETIRVSELKEIMLFQQWADEARPLTAAPVHTLVVVSNPRQSVWPHILAMQRHPHITIVCLVNSLFNVPSDVVRVANIFVSRHHSSLMLRIHAFDEVFSSVCTSLAGFDAVQSFCEARGRALVCIRKPGAQDQLAYLSPMSDTRWSKDAWSLVHQPLNRLVDMDKNVADDMKSPPILPVLGPEQVVWLHRRGLLPSVTYDQAQWVRAWTTSTHVLVRELLAGTPLPTVLCVWIAKEF